MNALEVLTELVPALHAGTIGDIRARQRLAHPATTKEQGIIYCIKY
jgi:hypothetical protein